MFSSKEGSAAKGFFYSAVFWLVVPVCVGLVMATLLSYPAIQHFVPDPLKTPINFGRLRPMHVNLAIFGWLSMAYVAGIFYITPRLTSAKLYSERLGNATLWLWNIFNVGILITFPLGYTQAREYAEMIWPLDILFLVILVMVAINVWGTIMRRKEKKLYVSLWDFMAAGVILPLVYAVGNKVWDFDGAYYGMTDNIVNYFYVHNLFNIWFTTAGLGLAYYLLPKLSGNPLHSHRLAVWGFFGIWTGQHHQLWSPAPDWLEIMTVVFSMLAAVPTTIFMYNFFMTMRGRWGRIRESVALRFFTLGALFWGFTCIQGLANSLREFSMLVHFTNWTVGHSHLAFVADYSFWAFALLYLALPHLVRRPIYSRTLVEWHFWLTFSGISIYMVSMWIAGVVQGVYWLQGLPFMDSVLAMHPYFVARMLGGAMIVGGQFVLAYNIWQTARGVAYTRQRATATLAPQEAIS
jgi:cbb3-type cytochrome c oxidase subunit I